MSAELQASKQLCANPSSTDLDNHTSSDDQTPAVTSAFQQRADHVTERLAETIRGLLEQLAQLGDRQAKWREMEALKQELIGWHAAKEKECERLCRQPVKLSADTAEEDVLSLTVRLVREFFFSSSITVSLMPASIGNGLL